MVKNREFTPDGVALRSNFLTVQGCTLRADVLPGASKSELRVNAHELGRILQLGRFAILDGIEDFYEHTLANNPGAEVVRPSIFTVRLGNTKQADEPSMDVFTEYGHANGGVIENDHEIQPGFHEYWAEVMAAGFKPEVRRTSGKKDGGAWLLLRKPTLLQVASDWLRFPIDLQPSLAQITDSRASKIDALTQLQDEFATRIDNFDDTIKSFTLGELRAQERTRMQVGALVGAFAFKQAAGLKWDIEADIDDVVTYANQYSPSAARAFENAI